MYYYGARYLDPKYSLWISADPAMNSGEYFPVAPTNDEAKRHNSNLPGMGGVYNTINFHLYHYAGNNPIKYTDPDGRENGTPISLKLGIPYSAEKKLIDREYKHWLNSFLPKQEIISENFLFEAFEKNQYSSFYLKFSMDIYHKSKKDLKNQYSNYAQTAEGLISQGVSIPSVLSVFLSITHYILESDSRKRNKIEDQLKIFTDKIDEYFNNSHYSIEVKITKMKDSKTGFEYYSMKANIYKDGEFYKSETGVIDGLAN